MNMKKLAIAAAVSAAIGGASGIASAAVTGLPGEALLVPMVLAADGATPAAAATYVALNVPVTIGQDTMINFFTAPHVAPTGSTPVTQTATGGDWRIYWTLFNHRSQKVEDGTCEVSPGDATLWTTDTQVQAAQATTRANMLAQGIVGRPSPVCGPSSPARFGYVTFQTIRGADGQDADFAFAGAAGILESVISADDRAFPGGRTCHAHG